MEHNDELEGFGEIFGIITVIIVLIVGGIYFFEQRMQKQEQIQKNNTEIMSTSTDDITSLKANVNALDFGDLGTSTDGL